MNGTESMSVKHIDNILERCTRCNLYPKCKSYRNLLNAKDYFIYVKEFYCCCLPNKTPIKVKVRRIYGAK